jgi:hypothetical protein
MITITIKFNLIDMIRWNCLVLCLEKSEKITKIFRFNTLQRFFLLRTWNFFDRFQRNFEAFCPDIKKSNIKWIHISLLTYIVFRQIMFTSNNYQCFCLKFTNNRKKILFFDSLKFKKNLGKLLNLSPSKKGVKLLVYNLQIL